MTGLEAFTVYWAIIGAYTVVIKPVAEQIAPVLGLG